MNNKILVIGYGSIGSRHVRILKKLKKNNQIKILTSQKITNRVRNYNEAITFNPDYIIVASQTNQHFNNLIFIEKNFYKKTVLIEKPLFASYKNFKAKKNLYFVGYNLRFNPILQNIKKLIRDQDIWNVNIFCGSNLSDWRPNRDYRTIYSASKKEGGGVLLDLSHEIDYVNWLFGPIKIIFTDVSKVSNLDINVEDNAIIIAKNYSGTVINISLNYFTKKPIRQILIDGKNISIKSDLVKKELTYIKNNKTYKNSYKKMNRNYTYQMQHKSILSNKNNLCSYQDGLEVLKLIDKIKKNSKI